MDSSTEYFRDLSFAITSDTGDLGLQAAILVKSIRRHYPNSDIFTFIPESSYPNMRTGLRKVFDKHTFVHTDEIPIPEYPLTALHAAFIKAMEVSNSKYVAALDTDTALLSKISKPKNSGQCDVFLKPEDTGEQYWGSKQSEEDWQRIYSYFDRTPPEMPSSLISSVDNSQLVSPYYQGAVVITSDQGFPCQWLEMTKEAVRNDIYEYDEDWFHEQITLAVLSQDYQVGLLTNRQNCPLYTRVTCPTEAELIHYLSAGRLYRHRQCESLAHLAQTDEFAQFIRPPTVSERYRLFYDNVTRFVPYPHHQKINIPIRWARKLIDTIPTE